MYSNFLSLSSHKWSVTVLQYCDSILSTAWSHAVLKQWHYCFPSAVFTAYVPTTYILLPGVLEGG